MAGPPWCLCSAAQPPAPAFEWQLLTPAQRKRKLAALREAARESKRQQRVETQQADEAVSMRVERHIPAADADLIVIDEPIEVPYLIHPTHRILHHRGFIACIRCGGDGFCGNTQRESPCGWMHGFCGDVFGYKEPATTIATRRTPTGQPGRGVARRRSDWNFVSPTFSHLFSGPSAVDWHY